MSHKTGRKRWIVALQLATLLAIPSAVLAGQRHLPPDVDLDPDRGMPFGRLPKTSFDRRTFDAMKKVLNSRVMDPTVEPYNSVVRPSRYDPGTGRIRDSITDALRDMRHNEDLARKYAETKGSKDQQQKKNLFPGLPRPERVMKSPVIDPVLAAKKAQSKDDDDDD